MNTTITVHDRGLCGICHQPTTKVVHPTLGRFPTWIHDARPQDGHSVSSVYDMTGERI